MLYRPHFCCHCGEKIIRAKWTLLTSRRFCDFCAIEQKQHDLFPRALMIVLAIFGAAGITSYFGSGSTANRPSNPARAVFVSPQKKEPASESTPPQNTATQAPETSPPRAAEANTKQLAPKPNSSTEPVYYCGALTKKGTACTRRVKTPGRCWQHLGQPSASGERK